MSEPSRFIWIISASAIGARMNSINLDSLEKEYRETPLNSKKYTVRLTNYIDGLLSKGKVVEAKHYLKKLIEVKPNHLRTIKLGYSISISSFDSEGVRKFDSQLYQSRSSEIDLLWFRLKYYISVNNIKDIESHCEFLLSKKLNNEQLNTILDLCINSKNYFIVGNLCNYINRNNMRLAGSGITSMKKIALQKLADTLTKV